MALPSKYENLPRRPRLYLAGPLFSEAEREFNRKLKAALSPFFEIYLPQEDGGLMVDLIGKGTPPDDASEVVFRMDVAAIMSAHLLLIVLDGRTVDEGASFELGLAYGAGKPCVGLQTDPRRLLPTGNNPMISRALKQVCCSTSELLSWAREMYGQPEEEVIGAEQNSGPFYKSATFPSKSEACELRRGAQPKILRVADDPS